MITHEQLQKIKDFIFKDGICLQRKKDEDEESEYYVGFSNFDLFGNDSESVLLWIDYFIIGVNYQYMDKTDERKIIDFFFEVLGKKNIKFVDSTSNEGWIYFEY